MSLPKVTKIHIREVWAHNLEKEFDLIRQIISDYPYVAMDTEFPGFVVEAFGDFVDVADNVYQTMRANVNLLKMIQLGFTFSDAKGNLPRFGTLGDCVWQFNFKDFNLDHDLHAYDAIQMLHRSGINFTSNRENGIPLLSFRKLLLESGILENQYMNWVTFHGNYDFGYLLNLIICRDLPSKVTEFFHLLRFYFPTIYDTKYVLHCNNLHGGLDQLARILNVQRFGQAHQAGSDSLLVSYIFQKLKERFMPAAIPGYERMYAGVLYGLENESQI